MEQELWLSFGRLTYPARLILVCLQERQMDGGELLRCLEEVHHIWIEPGTLWAALSRLERAGWISLQEFDIRIQQAPRYRVTDTGYSVLSQERNDLFEQKGNRLRLASRGILKECIMIVLKWILHLYPQAWRERYEAEMCSLLEEHDITLMTWIDLLWNALDAHLDPFYRKSTSLSPQKRQKQLRRSMIVSFGALPLSIFFYFAFINDAVDGPWDSLRQQPIMVVAHTLAMLAGAVILICIGLAITLLAYRGIKRQERPGSRFLHLLPLMGAGAPMAALSLAFLLPQISYPLNWVLFAFFFGGLLSVPAALALALARFHVEKGLHQALLILSMLTTLGMAMIYVTMLIEQGVTSIVWPGGNWSLQLIMGLILMGLPTIIALFFLVQSLFLLRKKEPPRGASSDPLVMPFPQQG
jgi:DNA-binding PadR family transcriptional regulator